MEKLALKNKILDLCLAQQQATIDHIEFAMDEAQKGANDYGQPKDRYDSYRIQLLRKRDLMAGQLHQAFNQMETLRKVDPKVIHDHAGFGAVVQTKEQNLFIAVGLGKINVNGRDYYAISPNVPIFEAIRHKRKGEEFSFRGTTQKILDIF